MKKRLNSISLRTRITLLTGAVILVVSAAITLASMQNAQTQFISMDASGKEHTEQPIFELNPGADLEITDKKDNDGTLMLDPATIEATREFNVRSLLYLLFFSVLGMGLAWILAGRALLPVRKLETAVSEISVHNLSDRLSVTEGQDEVGRLTDAFNCMLERLEHSFEQQKQFSSSVAHELKTPLATMKMSLQLALMEGREDDELLVVTERNVDRLISVVENLLEMTNDSAEGLNEQFTLCPLLREITEELTLLHPGIKISYVFSDQSVKVMGNRALVRRLFGNLIENAMKYNVSDGMVDICVTTASEKVRVTVADTGPGIPIEAQPHIFEPFYCADSSRSRKLGGAGLGLSVARAIAQRHNWLLTFENRPEGGTAFNVDIPC